MRGRGLCAGRAERASGSGSPGGPTPCSRESWRPRAGRAGPLRSSPLCRGADGGSSQGMGPRPATRRRSPQPHMGHTPGAVHVPNGERHLRGPSPRTTDELSLWRLCTPVNTHVCTYIHVCTHFPCTNTCAHKCMHAGIQANTCVCTYIRACTYTLTCTGKHARVHAALVSTPLCTLKGCTLKHYVHTKTLVCILKCSPVHKHSHARVRLPCTCKHAHAQLAGG